MWPVLIHNESLYQIRTYVLSECYLYSARRSRHPKRSRVTVDPQAILLGAPDFSTTKTRKWDSTRSMRWNQDAQREEGTQLYN